MIFVKYYIIRNNKKEETAMMNDDYNNSNKNQTVALAVSISVLVMVLIVTVVVLLNKDTLFKGTKKTASLDEASVSDYVQQIPSTAGDGRTVSDMDFYNKYASTSEDTSVSDEPVVEPEPEPEIDPATDGKHFEVISPAGTSEWLEISPYLLASSINYENLYMNDSGWQYKEGTRVVSELGVDISKDQGYIDFNKVKKAGIDFVMIRVGVRGYETGTLSFDDYYTDNLKRASDAGLEIGLYFMSQATTKKEAEAEAKFITDSIGDYSITYPIAFMCKSEVSYSSRTADLSASDRTDIALAFINKIKKSGYISMLYGSRYDLIKNYELANVEGLTDIWLSDTDMTFTTYPYNYSVLQYTKDGTVDGISGGVGMNISFVDFSLK